MRSFHDERIVSLNGFEAWFRTLLIRLGSNEPSSSVIDLIGSVFSSSFTGSATGLGSSLITGFISSFISGLTGSGLSSKIGLISSTTGGSITHSSLLISFGCSTTLTSSFFLSADLLDFLFFIFYIIYIYI